MLFVDKKQRSAKRLKNTAAAQLAFDSVGSFHNVKLTQIARNRRLLFTEGADDFRLFRRLAQILGHAELASGSGITNVESGGFSAWERVASFAWGISEALDESLLVGAVFDRDYRCDEEVTAVESELRQRLKLAFLLGRKELENYLLLPDVLQRALNRLLAEKEKRGESSLDGSNAIRDCLEEVTAPCKDDCLAQYIAKRVEYLKKSHRDAATVAAETLKRFNSRWDELESRMQIVPGKEVLKALRTKLMQVHGVTLTEARILSSMKPSDIPTDLVVLLAEIVRFAKADPSAVKV